MKRLASVFFVLLSGLMLLSCEDKIVAEKCSLSFSQDVLYLKPGSGDVTLGPRTSTSGRGIYAADPGGLSIDPQTGVINVTQTVFGGKYSGSGQRYLVKYISLDNSEICETFVTIAGIAYRPGIYNINTELKPSYNAQPEDRSQFPTGNYTATNPNVVLVRTANTNGENVINLKGSVDRGLFGARPIANGTAREVSIEYTLNDESQNAPNRTFVRFLYYARREDIPKEVIDGLNRDAEYPRSGRIKGVPPSDVVVVEN